MTDTGPSMFESLKRSWEERDAVEARRRQSGWYEAVVEFLAWQPTSAAIHSALRSNGDLDTELLLRTVTGLAEKGRREGRLAEHALFAAVHDTLSRDVRHWVPVPAAVARAGTREGDDAVDPLAMLHAQASLMAARAWLVAAERAVAEGRLTDSAEAAGKVLSTLQLLSADQRSWLQTHEVVELQLRAVQRRADAFRLLERFDRAAAGYSSLMSQTSEAAAARVGWFSEHEFRLAGLSALSAVARRRGQWELAVELAREAAQLSLQRIGSRDAATANNFGSALLGAGRIALALQQFRLAKELRDEGGSPAHEAFGEADCLRLAGDPDTAMRLYRAQLEQASRDEDWLPVVLFVDRVITGGVAPTSIEVGLLIAARERLPDDLTPALAPRLDLAIAGSQVARNQAAVAIPRCQSAIAAAVAVEPHSVVALRLRVVLAKALAGSSPASEASAPALAEARSEIDTVLDSVGRMLAETPIDERRSEIVGDWVDAYGVKLALTLPTDDTPSAIEDAFGIVEGAKSPTLGVRISRTHSVPMPAHVPQELAMAHARLQAIVEKLQDDDPGVAGIDERRWEQLCTARRELGRVEAEIHRVVGTQPRGRDGIASGELIDLLSHACPGPAAAVSFFSDENTTTAFVLRSGDKRIAVQRLPLGRASLTAIALGMRRAYNGATEEGYPAIRRNQPWRRVVPGWAQLEVVLSGLLDELDGLDHIVFAPHGSMHALPLHALRTRQGHVLAAKSTVSYAPSLSVLATLLARGTVSQRPRTVYAAGVAGWRDGRPELFEDDARLFPTESWQATIDSGPAVATRERVLSGIGSGVDVIHLSCHGVFTPGRPGRSGLLFSDGRLRPPILEAELSLVRRRRHLVSVQDVVGRHVSARLVTLRACSSGLLAARNAGDEFDGLTRSLLASGARATLASLWNVDQISSGELLEHFYANWAGPNAAKGPARALADAQQTLLGSEDPALTHPYHWAPFALVGDWR